MTLFPDLREKYVRHLLYKSFGAWIGATVSILSIIDTIDFLSSLTGAAVLVTINPVSVFSGVSILGFAVISGLAVAGIAYYIFNDNLNSKLEKKAQDAKKDEKLELDLNETKEQIGQLQKQLQDMKSTLCKLQNENRNSESVQAPVPPKRTHGKKRSSKSEQPRLTVEVLATAADLRPRRGTVRFWERGPVSLARTVIKNVRGREYSDIAIEKLASLAAQNRSESSLLPGVTP